MRAARNESMKVIASDEEGCLAELKKTAYFTDGRSNSVGQARHWDECALLAWPREQHLTLRVGDLLALTADDQPIDPPSNDNAETARIGCTLPHVLAAVAAGDPVWFDDGKIGARVEKASADALILRITQIAHASGRAKLASDKGINFPDNALPVRAPTEDDIETLAFAAKHADIVQMSFANSAEDVIELIDHLERLTRRTLSSVENRDPCRIRKLAQDAARRHAIATIWRHDRPGRPGRRDRFRTFGRNSGRDAVPV